MTDAETLKTKFEHADLECAFPGYKIHLIFFH